MATNRITQVIPKTTTERNRQWRLRNQNRTKHVHLSLPKSAYGIWEQAAIKAGISLPALMLAVLDHVEMADPSELQKLAVTKAKLHGLRIAIEHPDGTRTRIRTGSYRKGSGRD